MKTAIELNRKVTEEEKEVEYIAGDLIVEFDRKDREIILPLCISGVPNPPEGVEFEGVERGDIPGPEREGPYMGAVIQSSPWRLSEVGGRLVTKTENLRRMWAHLWIVKAYIEASYITSFPSMPFKSVIKTFDFKASVPEQVKRCNWGRKAILIEQ